MTKSGTGTARGPFVAYRGSTTAGAQPADERPAVVLTQAAGHDGRRRRFLTALATAIEAPEEAGHDGAGVLTVLLALALALAAWAG